MKKLFYLMPLCIVLLFSFCSDGNVLVKSDENISTKSATSVDRSRAFAINKKLGRGMNMGNAFEEDVPGSWGNPWKPEYFKLMADMGFKHVRLPVRWEPNSMAGAPYTINPDFLEKIRAVVDEALKYDMYIIVNMHHHDALMKNPEGQKVRFLSQWEQIGEYFKDYSDKLLFEVMNEPHSKLTAELWNVFLDDALKVIRKSNPDRIVLIGERGLDKLVIPDDENIIVTVHHYSPFNFTHQGAHWMPEMEKYVGLKWNDTDIERADIRKVFKPIAAYSQDHNVPIHIGEFGAYQRADMDSRARWTTYVARYAERLGFSWAYWEFSSSFGIYDPKTDEFKEPLVKALLHNKMAEPTPVVYIPVFHSSFSPDNVDKWHFYNNVPGVSAKQQKGQYIFYLNGEGVSHEQTQLVRYGLKLEKSKRYRLSFLASATKECTFLASLSYRTAPWTLYHKETYTVGKNEAVYSFNFTMLHDTDEAVRLVFDFGKSQQATLLLKAMKLSEINY